MIHPPRRPLFVRGTCTQCGTVVREAWLIGGRRLDRIVRRVVIHHDPAGPYKLTESTRVQYVGPPVDGIAGHEPNRYSLHRTDLCNAQVPETPATPAPPVVDVAGQASSGDGSPRTVSGGAVTPAAGPPRTAAGVHIPPARRASA